MFGGICVLARNSRKNEVQRRKYMQEALVLLNELAKMGFLYLILIHYNHVYLQQLMDSLMHCLHLHT